MSLKYITLKKTPPLLSYRRNSFRDSYLETIFFIMQDMIGPRNIGMLQDMLNEHARVESNASRIVKLPSNMIGMGYLTSLFENYALYPIHHDIFFDIAEQWQVIYKKNYPKIVLAQDGNNIWFSEYHEFCKKYGLDLDQDIEYDIDQIEGGFIGSRGLPTGPSILSEDLFEENPGTFTVKKNIDNKYGLVDVACNFATIEKTMFLWGWDFEEFFPQLSELIGINIQEFGASPIFWQGEMVVKDTNGYTITVVIDYAKNQIIAAYPCRSNFY